MVRNEMSYYRLYLLHLKKEWGVMFTMSDDELDERADAAEEEYENARRDGLTVDQAQERAMSILLDGLGDES